MTSAEGGSLVAVKGSIYSSVSFGKVRVDKTNEYKRKED